MGDEYVKIERGRWFVLRRVPIQRPRSRRTGGAVFFGREGGRDVYYVVCTEKYDSAPCSVYDSEPLCFDGIISPPATVDVNSTYFIRARVSGDMESVVFRMTDQLDKTTRYVAHETPRPAAACGNLERRFVFSQDVLVHAGGPYRLQIIIRPLVDSDADSIDSDYIASDYMICTDGLLYDEDTEKCEWP